MLTNKGIRIRLSADFSIETLQARREWQEIFKVLKGKNMQPRIVYPADFTPIDMTEKQESQR